MQKTAILYDASQAILSTFDLDEVLKQILSIVRDYFRVDKVAVLLVDPKTKKFSLRSQIGGFQADLALPTGRGIIGQAARQKRPIYAADVSKNSHYVVNFPDTSSELAIPLMVRDEVVGVLDIQSDHPDHFDQEDLDLLALFSTQASIAIENARLYSLEQERAAQLEAINAIARQTTALLDLDELLATVCDLVLEHFHVDQVVVLVAEDDQLIIRAYKGKLTPCLPKGAALPGSGVSMRALETGKPIIENEVALVRNYIAGFIETRSEICVPLIFYGAKLGVLALESATPNRFQAEDAHRLEAVADICAAAIQNANLFQKVQKLAYLDGLTGIYNRRHFEQQITAEIERASRYSTHFSVIMIDIDHFKKLNDEFGHLLGDEVLRQVSSLFQQQLRKVDVVCRYGGEEFAIIIPQTTGANAIKTAEKLRRKIESYLFPGVPKKVTISAGVAEYPVHGKSRDELVAAADSALYAAKQDGRNQAKPAPVSQGTNA